MSTEDHPRASVSRLRFSDDTDVHLKPSDVIVLLGPNNAGKSATLNEIAARIRHVDATTRVLQKIIFEKHGSSENLLDWLNNDSTSRPDPSSGQRIYSCYGHRLGTIAAKALWQRAPIDFDELSWWFCSHLKAEERLALGNPPPNIRILHDAPQHPIHLLQRDEKLEGLISTKFRKAFNADLILHRNAGNQVPLYVGERPTLAAGEHLISRSYLDRLEKLPFLQHQGDGMRSFAGILLAAFASRESILLIDEPEAFLHPPQARMLGELLVRDRHEGRQLFLATHSTDLLRGVLNSESKDIRVIRLQRSGSVNHAKLLENDGIRELWNDPLLRYSNILDGLFHQEVIVCESDADCRFYGALADSMFSTKADKLYRRDVMFTHCNGKSRLAVVAKALRKVDVPVKVIADFDILQDEQPFRDIVDALSLHWTEIEFDWNCVRSSLGQKKADLSSDHVKDAISKILATVSDDLFPRSAADKIQGVLRHSSPWALAKSLGKSFVPHGDASKACERLLKKLRDGGLHIVDVGELNTTS